MFLKTFVSVSVVCIFDMVDLLVMQNLTLLILFTLCKNQNQNLLHFFSLQASKKLACILKIVHSGG